MTDREPAEVKNLDRYGFPALEWSRAVKALATTPTPAVTFFLGTVGSDGKPNAAGFGALYMDGDIYFTSSLKARKARNLTAKPACTISARMADIDLILEGEAARVTDGPTLERAASRYQRGGWPAEVQGDAFTAPFNAPSAGPPPWHLFRFRFRAVFGVATAEPYGATRWRFNESEAAQ